jgi:prephenate dehydrogenase
MSLVSGRGRQARRQARWVVDVDSTICEVVGKAKQGAGFGYTHVLGYHPLLATIAGSGEILHGRLRKGSANTQRGTKRFVNELVARARRDDKTRELTVRSIPGSGTTPR